MEVTLKPLTEKEQQLLRRIREHIALKGHAPTLDELAAAARKSKVTIYEQVRALEQKGYIKKDKHKKRGLTVLHDNPVEELRRVKAMLRKARDMAMDAKAALALEGAYTQVEPAKPMQPSERKAWEVIAFLLDKEKA